MPDMLNYVVPLALVAVSIVLMLGLWNMLRGGNANRSQMLMRWRVGLQFAAIILLVLAVLWTQSTS
jgi:NADH:ubiquinone oxidoreductase subunit H